MNVLREQVLKGTIWSASQSWGVQVISLTVFIVLSRFLLPESFGLLALASLFVTFVQTFLDQGISLALVQRVQVDPEHLDTAFWMNVLFGFMLTVSGIFLAQPISLLFREPLLRPVIAWLSPLFVINGLSSTQQAILQRELAFRLLAIRALVSNLFGGILSIILAVWGFGVWSLVVQNLVVGLVGVVLLWNVSPWRPRFIFSWVHFNDLQGFGIDIVGMNILNFVNRRADDMLIGYYLGVVELGYYTVAYRILLALTELLTGFANQVAFPIFSRLQSDPGRIRQAFLKATELMSYISFPLFGGFGLIAPDLIKVFFGDQWLPSIPVLQILMAVGALHSILYFHTSLMLASGASDKRFRLTLLNATINISAFILVVHWGIVAIALAYALRAYFLAPIELLAVKYTIGIDLKEYTGQFVTPLISTLFMIGFVYGGMFLFDNILSGVWRLIAGSISGLIVYLFVLSFLNSSVLRQGWALFRSLLGSDTVNG